MVVASSVKVGNAVVAMAAVVFATFGVTFSIEDPFIGIEADCLESAVPEILGLASVLISAAVCVFRTTGTDSVVMGVTGAVLRHVSITPTRSKCIEYQSRSVVDC